MKVTKRERELASQRKARHQANLPPFDLNQPIGNGMCVT